MEIATYLENVEAASADCQDKFGVSRLMLWGVQVLQDPKWPADPPFEAEDFQKYDASPDTYFYSQVQHWSLSDWCETEHLSGKIVKCVTPDQAATLYNLAIVIFCAAKICDPHRWWSNWRIDQVSFALWRMAFLPAIAEHSASLQKEEPLERATLNSSSVQVLCSDAAQCRNRGSSYPWHVLVMDISLPSGLLSQQDHRQVPCLSHCLPSPCLYPALQSPV